MVDRDEQAESETVATVASSPTSKPVASGDDAPTVAARGSEPGGTRSRYTVAGSTIATNPGQAMLNDEILRARIFGIVITSFAVLTLGAVLMLGGHPIAKALFAGFLGIYTLVSAWYTVRLYRKPESYQQGVLIWIALLALPTAYTGVYYWGFFSPAAIVIVMALYFNSLVGSFVYTLCVYLAMALTQGGIAALILADYLPDVGLIRAESATLLNEVLTQVVIQAVLLATYVMARLSRRATQATIAQLDEAVRDIAHREALLLEARQELDRANWAGGVGRFTDQTLGSYRLGAVLGRGAMGEVYEAVHVDTHELAAVKLLQRNVLSNPDIVRRFAREAEAAAAIKSPNVVNVYEVGDDPLPYIAMEKLDGHDLAQILRSSSSLSKREIVDMVAQLARGIDAAHAAGIVHRDLKPQNVYRVKTSDKTAVWKLLDFGVSKLADSSGTITQGSVIGTPAYMAPEQARGEDADGRADVYGLGAITYRVVTGQPPFSAKDTPSLLHAVVYDTPAPPSEVNSALGPAVDAVIANAMAKKRGDRYRTATELAEALASAMNE